MVHIKIPDNSNIVQVDRSGHLMVCLCDNTEDRHAKLQEMLEAGWTVQLFVEDETGEILPLTLGMLDGR